MQSTPAPKETPVSRSRHVISRVSRPRLRTGCALLLIALLAAACSPERAFEAAWLLRDVTAAAEGGSATEQPAAIRREPIAYRGRTGSHVGDLYLPGSDAAGVAEPERAAVVLVPGLAPAGRDDQRLVALATALASARFAVLVPEIASLRAQRVSPRDVEDIADAIAFLARSSTADPARPIGVIAVSYAVGPALLASMHPDVAGATDFLVGIGGYYALDAVVTFFTTGFYRDEPDRPWRHRTPNSYGKWVFLESNAEAVRDAADRTSLQAIARRRQQDAGAPIDDLVASLGPEGRSVYALIANRDPDRVPALMAALPPQVRDVMDALDLKSRELRAAPPRLLLIHGRDDPIIPASESRALAAAAPEGAAHLFLVDNLAHADVGPARVADAWKLWRAAYLLLSWRDQEG